MKKKIMLIVTLVIATLNCSSSGGESNQNPSPLPPTPIDLQEIFLLIQKIRIIMMRQKRVTVMELTLLWVL